jgi:hypothetical protein
MHFPASNNVTEYEALLHGLWIAMTLDIRRLKILGDSLLVINQANKEWPCLDDKILEYCQEIRKLENNFDGLEYHHVLWGRNEVADELTKFGSNQVTLQLGVFMQELHEPSISKALDKSSNAAEPIDDIATPADNMTDSSKVMIVDSNWCTLFMIYLKIGGLPNNKVERDRLKWRAVHYTLVGEELFWWSANSILMRCVPTEEGCAILQDIHLGVCGNHTGVRILVGKAYMHIFYWPTVISNADSLVHRCEGCQYFAHQKHVPAGELRTISITWPFSTSGLDLVGPFKATKGGFTHIFVVVDKFTKWIEAKPVATIIAAKAVEFVSEIMHHFGVLNTIITDNGTQFIAREFTGFCDDAGIKANYASVSHPQSNRQVKLSNGVILHGLKPRIFDRLKPYAAKWMKELPLVLLALCMTPS